MLIMQTVCLEPMHTRRPLADWSGSAVVFAAARGLNAAGAILTVGVADVFSPLKNSPL